MITADDRTAIERVSRMVATGASLGDLLLADVQRLLRATERAAGIPPRMPAPRRSDRPGGTVAVVTEDYGSSPRSWLSWWSAYDQRWVSDTDGEVLIRDDNLRIEVLQERWAPR